MPLLDNKVCYTKLFLFSFVWVESLSSSLKAKKHLNLILAFMLRMRSMRINLDFDLKIWTFGLKSKNQIMFTEVYVKDFNK